MPEYPKISVNVLGYNEKHQLKGCFERLMQQDYPNFEVTYIDNASTDGSEDYVRQNFPSVKVIQTGANKRYCFAHNVGIRQTDGEFIAIMNNDLEAAPDYLSEAIKPMLADPKIAGVQGKMLRPEPVDGKYIFDGTGLFLTHARTVRDRGQLKPDVGQYDTPGEIFGVNGAAPLYRRAALNEIAINGEVLDEDMVVFYDDTDLGWRLRLLGWKLWYQPTAVIYHARGFGQSPTGWRNPWGFRKHRQAVSLKNRQFAWRNQIFLVLKNDYGWPFWSALPRILVRQIAFAGYSVLFEPSSIFGALPDFFHHLPSIMRKRKWLKKHAKISPNELKPWFGRLG